MDLREIRYEGVYWIELVQAGVHWWAFANNVLNLWIP
jgi:hypothetical protein